MITRIVKTKRCLFLLVGLLIFNLTFAQQQNLFGFKGGRANLQGVMLQYYAGGQITEKPDTIFRFGAFESDRLYRFGFPKLHFYVYESVRFDGNNFMVSNAGMGERPIAANVIERQKDESWGKVILTSEHAAPIDAEYMYDSQAKILHLKYTMSDWESDKHMELRMQKALEGLTLEFAEYENKTIPGIYTVSVEYLIK